MTRIEGIIYGIGKLDAQPTGVLVNSVDLDECHESLKKGYQLCKVNILDRNHVDLVRVNPKDGKTRDVIISVNRSQFNDTHDVAELIALAYERYSKRHLD